MYSVISFFTYKIIISLYKTICKQFVTAVILKATRIISPKKIPIFNYILRYISGNIQTFFIFRSNTPSKYPRKTIFNINKQLHLTGCNITAVWQLKPHATNGKLNFSYSLKKERKKKMHTNKNIEKKILRRF